ncbi:MAG: Rid family detoxifying hydrolase [Tatlockia sp.]|jgi:reactive intermediate/imine deaminase
MKAIETALAPAAIGTYSQAIRVENTVYLSGQIPLNPNTMQLCSDEIRLQINQVFDNLAVVCEEAGGSLSNLVKITVYLTDLSHFPLVNEAMTHYFSKPYPARAAIGVSELPRKAQVEVDGIMVLA